MLKQKVKDEFNFRIKRWSRQKAVAFCLFPMFLWLLMGLWMPHTLAKGNPRTVKVAFFPMEGYHTVEEDGSYGGMDVEYLTAICNYADWEIEYVECNSWEAALDMLEHKKVDLVGSAQYSEERAQKFLYAELSSGYTFGAIAVNGNSELAYEDFEAMRSLTFGMVEGYVRKPEFMQYLKDHGIYNPDIVEYEHTEQMQQAMDGGDVDAYVHTFTELEEGHRLIGRFAPKPFYYITYPENEEVMRELDQAISELKMEWPTLETELWDKYYYNRLEDNALLTLEEKNYIAQKKNILVGYVDGYYPFSYKKNNVFTGIAKDILEEKVASTGLSLSYTEYATQKDALAALEEGKIDVLSYCVDMESVEKSKHLSIVKEYASVPVVLVTKNSASVDKIKNIAVVPYLKKEADTVLDTAQMEVINCSTQRESIKAVQEGKYDAALCDGYLVEYLLRTDSLYNELQVQNVLNTEQAVCMVVAEEKEGLLKSILDKSLPLVDTKRITQYMLKENAYSLLSIRQFVGNHSIAIITILALVLGVVILVTAHLIRDSRKIQKLMYKDADTNIWNLNYFVFHGENKLLSEKRSSYAVVCFHVAQLRQYNMIYGWNAGVKVIQMVADTLKKNMDVEKEIYAINQGERFVLLLLWDEWDYFVNRLNELKIEVEDCIREHTENRMTVQYGVYKLPQDNMDLYLAASYAGQALDFVNDSEVRDIKLYDDALAEMVKERHKREKLLESVDINKDFVVYYQPKVDIRNDHIVGAEALVRFKDPTANGAIRAPGFFIPYFEQTGRVLEIDFFVFETVCKMLRRRLDACQPVVTISCNFSRMHFMRADFPQRLEAVLDKYSIPKDLIEVEITETLIMEEILQKRVKMTLDTLAEKGIRLSIDDFGAGYSSLGVFEQIPASVIKLDRSFLLNQEDHDRQVKIMRGIVRLSEELDAQIVCEGVETTDDISLMREIGAYVAQGYFYSKPVPEEEFEMQLL